MHRLDFYCVHSKILTSLILFVALFLQILRPISNYKRITFLSTEITLISNVEIPPSCIPYQSTTVFYTHMALENFSSTWVYQHQEHIFFLNRVGGAQHLNIRICMYIRILYSTNHDLPRLRSEKRIAIIQYVSSILPHDQPVLSRVLLVPHQITRSWSIVIPALSLSYTNTIDRFRFFHFLSMSHCHLI